MPTWMWMGPGTRPAVKPSCRGLCVELTVVSAHLLGWREWVRREPFGEDSGPLPQPCTPPGPPPRRTNYHGSCPQDLAESSWIPFREHCYSFHLELKLGHKEALQRCQRGGQGRLEPVGLSSGDPFRGHSDPMDAVSTLHPSPRPPHRSARHIPIDRP